MPFGRIGLEISARWCCLNLTQAINHSIHHTCRLRSSIAFSVASLFTGPLWRKSSTPSSLPQFKRHIYSGYALSSPSPQITRTFFAKLLWLDFRRLLQNLPYRSFNVVLYANQISIWPSNKSQVKSMWGLTCWENGLLLCHMPRFLLVELLHSKLAQHICGSKWRSFFSRSSCPASELHFLVIRLWLHVDWWHWFNVETCPDQAIRTSSLPKTFVEAPRVRLWKQAPFPYRLRTMYKRYCWTRLQSDPSYRARSQCRVP